ncbi:hypothetical protein LNP17_11760 [Klebsiella variicola subsp. variicola]|nr:hypothetical protein [Klebsiella variicola subsp. variicola]
MQTISFENYTQDMAVQLKTKNHYSLMRRDRQKCRAIFAAVQGMGIFITWSRAGARRKAGGRTVGETKRSRHQR